MLISEVPENHLDEILNAFAQRGELTEDDLGTLPAAQILMRRRHQDLRRLNSWLNFHTAVRGGETNHKWALSFEDRRAAFGVSSRYLAALAREVAPSPCYRIADFGCGTGMHSLALAEAFPDSTVRGFEVATEMRDAAWHNRVEKSRNNFFIEAASPETAASRYPSHFDLAVSCKVAHFSDGLLRHYRRIRSALRRGGVLIVKEFVLAGNPSDLEFSFLQEEWCRHVSFTLPPVREKNFLTLMQECGFQLEKQISSQMEREWMRKNFSPAISDTEAPLSPEWSRRIAMRKYESLQAARQLGIPMEKMECIEGEMLFFIFKAS